MVDTLKGIAKEVHTDIIKHERGDLSGWCAIASMKISRKLKKAGIPHKLHIAVENYCERHVFVTVNDYLIDVTATQFGIRKSVVVRQFSKAQEYEFWRSKHSFDDINSLKNHMIKTGWPTAQIYLTKRKNRERGEF